jgi:hypothetical protein
MKKFSNFIILLILFLIAGTAIFLSVWDIPAPTSQVEKVISNDRFKK